MMVDDDAEVGADADDDDDPPPDEEVDHLVEQIYRQYTLHRVVVHVNTHHSHCNTTRMYM